MRFLVDESLSARIVAVLADAGHEATHVTQVGLAAIHDAVILRAAADSDSVVLTADVDVGTLLASLPGSNARCPRLSACLRTRRTT
jgi:predicted nuclease of predicted toxin-antitoxin system